MKQQRKRFRSESSHSKPISCDAFFLFLFLFFGYEILHHDGKCRTELKHTWTPTESYVIASEIIYNPKTHTTNTFQCREKRRARCTCDSHFAASAWIYACVWLYAKYETSHPHRVIQTTTVVQLRMFKIRERKRKWEWENGGCAIFKLFVVDIHSDLIEMLKKTPSVLWYASLKQMLACLWPVRIAPLNQNVDGNTHPLIISLLIDSLQRRIEEKKTLDA